MSQNPRTAWIRNSGLNLLGQVLPIAVGLLTIPRLIHGLGEERFSLLTLAWAALGYFTLFDLGFGRATTKMTAENLARARLSEMNSLFWSSSIALVAVSALGAVLLAGLSPLVIERFRDISPDLRPEVQWSIYLLAASLPILTLTANSRGLMEAQGKFFAINILQALVGALSYSAPLLLLTAEQPLLKVIAVLVALRALNLGAHLALNFSSLPLNWRRIEIRSSTIKELWRFGGWLTVSNIVGPILFYFDRFVLGLVVPVQSIAHYTTPVEVVTKLWIIPSSITRVLFPEFTGRALDDPERAHRLYIKSSLTLAALMAVPCGILILGAEPLLKAWISAEFAEPAAPCLQILALGLWINSIAWVPFTALQSLGKTRLIALIHTGEILPYALAFWLLTREFGLSGAAWAWTLRTAIDAIALFWATDVRQARASSSS